MAKYSELSKEEIQSELKSLMAEYESQKSLGLKLDMSRGKPEPGQLDLSMDMMDVMNSKADFITKLGTDTRNYGDIDGIRESKVLMSRVMGIEDYMSVIVFGNASLSIMFDAVSRSYTHGVLGSTPWCKLPEVKFLCPVPGYDRHFTVTEHFGIKMINIPMTTEGPDMDMVEEYIKDDSVKGIWCVPKYSNPQGITYSDAVIERFASLKPAAADFRIYWDNAYNVHHLYDEESMQDKIPDILKLCKEHGNEDLVYVFGSTSKVSLAGSGIAAMACSPSNIKEILSSMNVRTICYDKINQLRHARYFDSMEKITKRMSEHAAILRPKFQAVNEIFKEEIEPYGAGSWINPKGGYFITYEGKKGSAKRIVELCKDAGVTLTPAGAPFPYHKDPNDNILRIAPSYPNVEEIKKAAHLFALCARIATLECLSI